MYQVNLSGLTVLTPVLVKAIQELTEQNKEMKAEIEELKKK